MKLISELLNKRQFYTVRIENKKLLSSLFSAQIAYLKKKSFELLVIKFTKVFH